MPRINFLFWNVNRKQLDERVGRVVVSERIDVVMLAEPGTPAPGLAGQLEELTGHRFSVDGSTDRFTTCYRLPRRSLRLQLEVNRWLIYRAVVDSIPEFLLVVAHLPSKLHTHEHTQALSARELIADVSRAEDRRRHRRTILVGDLNMNPFDPGVAGASGLHGVISRTVVERETRQIQGREYRMFYNPMWNVLGDRPPGPPGTFYRSAAEAVNYYWNTYDQVLLRPELSGHLRILKILDSDGVETLLTHNGLPNVANGSDHLPLVFHLEW